jgi:hypothetical protein
MAILTPSLSKVESLSEFAKALHVDPKAILLVNLTGAPCKRSSCLLTACENTLLSVLVSLSLL